MFVGIAKGKVAVDVTREDALTAATLGCLRYLPADILFEWLSLAQTIERVPLALTATGHLDGLTMWPSFPLSRTETVEPDAQLDLVEHSIVIEAKLHSGKSQGGDESEGSPTDQLARQWLAVRRARPSNHPVSVVFVTAHPFPPYDELQESQQALSAIGGTSVFWLSWRSLARVLSGKRELRPEQRVLVADMLAYLVYVLPGGVMPFAGFPAWLTDVDANSHWQYTRHSRFTISVPAEAIWQYAASATWFALGDLPDKSWRYGGSHV